MLTTKKDLDDIFDLMLEMTKKEIIEAKNKSFYSKDLVECVSIVLSVGYERLKHDK